jgi:hypothetical protein
MKLGTNDIGSVYLGTNAVQKVYLGANEVWSSYAYLLDDYSGAAAAYSLRLLRSAYTGDAIRVRRASDNTEQDIGFVSNELDTSALTTFCSGTDGFVKTWYDQSGNANDATQTTSANQPQIVSSGSVILENGKPSLDFDGSNDFFNLTSSISTNVNYTGFQVLKRNSTSISITLAGINLGDSYLAWNYNDNNVYFRSARGFIQTSLNSINQTLFTSLNIQSGNMTIYQDGTSIISGTPTTLVGTSLMNAIGRRASDYGIGTTQELIFYSSDQSSNRTGIETNINDFYSIY